MTTAYYSRQSLSHSLNKRRRNGATLEWVGSEKGQGRAGPTEKRSAAALGGKHERERQHFSWLPAVEGLLCKLGQNEMQSCYVYSLLQGTGANSSPIYLLKLQNHEHHKYGKLSHCEKKANKEWENKPQTSIRQSSRWQGIIFAEHWKVSINTKWPWSFMIWVRKLRESSFS